MRTFFATVLSVIALGVVVIAYGLLAPRAAAAPGGIIQYDARGDASPLARPMYASERTAVDDLYASPAARARTAVYETAAPSAPRYTATTPARTVTRVERASGRDWKKTALVIGGSTASGAGLGAIFGGKKGALIGAAIGGGASTLWEATKR